MKFVSAQGKRKRAVARATLTPKPGKFVINGQSLAAYGNKLSRLRLQEPLVLAGDLAEKVKLQVTVSGGGEHGQVDAARLAIARALVQYQPKLKEVFDEYDRLLLVADVRRKEVCKPNDSKARAKRQKSYR
jgi:small subunit ribosomal protein S9